MVEDSSLHELGGRPLGEENAFNVYICCSLTALVKNVILNVIIM
jgi:hypothetical protein